MELQLAVVPVAVDVPERAPGPRVVSDAGGDVFGGEHGHFLALRKLAPGRVGRAPGALAADACTDDRRTRRRGEDS